MRAVMAVYTYSRSLLRVAARAMWVVATTLLVVSSETARSGIEEAFAWGAGVVADHHWSLVAGVCLAALGCATVSRSHAATASAGTASTASNSASSCVLAQDLPVSTKRSIRSSMGLGKSTRGLAATLAALLAAACSVAVATASSSTPEVADGQQGHRKRTRLEALIAPAVKALADASAGALAVYILLTLVLGVQLWVMWSRRKVSGIPSPPAWPIMGNVPEMLSGSPWAKFTRWYEKYGPMYVFFIFNQPMIIVTDPEAAKAIFRTNLDRYRKDTSVYRVFGRLLGNGLVTSEGKHWASQKKKISPLFQHSALGYTMQIFSDAADRMEERWAKAPVVASGSSGSGSGSDARPFRRVEIGEFFRHLTLEIISAAALGLTPEQANVFPPLFLAILDELNMRVWYPWRGWFPTPSNRQLHRRLDELDRIVNERISHKRETLGIARDSAGASEGAAAPATTGVGATSDDGGMTSDEGGSKAVPAGNDLLDMCLATGMSDAAIADEMRTMLLAGHETSSMLLTFGLYLLATHPDAMAKARAEVDAALPATGYGTASEYRGLTYLAQVLDETLRLYTVVPVLPRVVVKEDTLCGRKIPTGASVAVNIWGLHHRADIWGDDVEEFRPERFAEKGRHPFSFLPFAQGPRQCMGRNFALLEAKLLLASILRRYEVKLEPGQPPVECDAYIVPVRPKEDMWLHVRRRADV